MAQASRASERNRAGREVSGIGRVRARRITDAWAEQKLVREIMVFLHNHGVGTSNLPFQEWTTVFASERLTGALLDRITHHVHILEMNGESYRLKQSRSGRQHPSE